MIDIQDFQLKLTLVLCTIFFVDFYFTIDDIKFNPSDHASVPESQREVISITNNYKSIDKYDRVSKEEIIKERNEKLTKIDSESEFESWIGRVVYVKEDNEKGITIDIGPDVSLTTIPFTEKFKGELDDMSEINLMGYKDFSCINQEDIVKISGAFYKTPEGSIVDFHLEIDNSLDRSNFLFRMKSIEPVNKITTLGRLADLDC